MDLNKEQRKRKVLALVGDHEVSTQEDLLNLLQNEGINVNQSTLSRDLRELGVKKRSKNGIMRYVPKAPSPSYRQTRTISAGIKATMYAGEMGEQILISTKRGYAQSLALDIEMAEAPEIMGIVHGNSSIIVIGVKGVSRQELAEAIVRAVPEISQAR